MSKPPDLPPVGGGPASVGSPRSPDGAKVRPIGAVDRKTGAEMPAPAAGQSCQPLHARATAGARLTKATSPPPRVHSEIAVETTAGRPAPGQDGLLGYWAVWKAVGNGTKRGQSWGGDAEAKGKDGERAEYHPWVADVERGPCDDGSRSVAKASRTIGGSDLPAVTTEAVESGCNDAGAAG